MSAAAINTVGNIAKWGFGTMARNPVATAKWGLGGTAGYYGYQYAVKPAMQLYKIGQDLFGSKAMLYGTVAAGAFVAYQFAKSAWNNLTSSIKWGVGLAAGAIGLAYLYNKFSNNGPAIASQATPEAGQAVLLGRSQAALERAFGGRGATVEENGVRAASFAKAGNLPDINTGLGHSAENPGARANYETPIHLDGEAGRGQIVEDPTARANYEPQLKTQVGSGRGEFIEESGERVKARTSLDLGEASGRGLTTEGRGARAEALKSQFTESGVPRIKAFDPTTTNPHPEMIDRTKAPTRSVPAVSSSEFKAAAEGAESTAVDSATILGKLTDARKAIGARMGGNIPVVGGGIGAAAAGLTGALHYHQRDYANALLREGTLTEEAHGAYMKMNMGVQSMFTGDIALSVADPTGASFIATLGAENAARGFYQDWADKHAPHLSEDALQGLNMSWFDAKNASKEMVESLQRNIPNQITASTPAALHDVIKAKQELRSAIRENYDAPVISGATTQFMDDATREQMTAHRDVLQGAEDTARKNFMSKIQTLASEPDGMTTYLNILPMRDRLSYASRIGESERGQALLTKHPEVSKYVNGGWFAPKPSSGALNNFIMTHHNPSSVLPRVSTQAQGVTPKPVADMPVMP